LQQLKCAFLFIRNVYKLAFDHPALQKSWVRMAIGGSILWLIWLIPLILVVSLIGLVPIGLILIGLLIILGMASLFVWGQITSLETSRVFDLLIQEADAALGIDDQDQSADSTEVEDALFFIGLPGLRLLTLLRRLFKAFGEREYQWIDGHYLVLPVMANEQQSAQEATVRVKQLLDHNRVRFQPGLIRVELIAQVVQWVLIVLGFVLGFIVGKNVADPITARILIQVLATIIGSLIGVVFTVIGIHFKTLTLTCYHTALYQWVRNVESAALSANPDQAKPPFILSQALGRTFVNEKES